MKTDCFDRIVEHPRRAAIFVDFDGTLSAIVEHPNDSRPIDGATDALNSLGAKYGVVAVISGRPLAFLAEHLPVDSTVQLCGLYGLQRLRSGQIAEEPQAAKWRDVVDRGATTAEAELPRSIHVERKGLSFALHYRAAREFGSAAEEWAARYAAQSGLDAQRARFAIELGPFHDVNKGTVVRELAEGFGAGCFIGDDSGDLPAFRALDDLSSAGTFYSVKIAVRSSEVPSGLVEAADLAVDGPSGVLEILHLLAH